ncbi:MAG: penicillin acylase family protein, partial [Proteobacteria bacterium]|nr:penicillin acylase family protein [Pseudomonadota bacterium]
SNGQVAWSFTNSYGDWIDLVRLDVAACEEGYLTTAGCEPFETVSGEIEVAHGESGPFEFRRTRWGPVIESVTNGSMVRYALRWTAHDAEATNLALHELARAGSVHEALDIARRSGMPPQNFVAGDADGNIAWTIVGRIPKRSGHDGRLPLASAGTENVWEGWLAPEEYPGILNPDHGRLWTANARAVDGEALERIGDGGYALGARAGQIRDRLFEKEQLDEHDMLRIQLDDEARFLSRWHEFLGSLLDDAAIAQRPGREKLREVLAGWEGRAAIDAVAYRVVRRFRDEVFSRVFDGLTAEVKADFPEFEFGVFSQAEGPLWQLVTEQPAHLLPPGNSSWRALFLDVADSVQDERLEGNWGERNLSAVRHPLGGLPLIGLMLNAGPRPLPGDKHMPRVQGRSFGASQRFAVSPGRETEGYFHMPGGQSGHPLSPFYLTGHTSWEEGVPTPFLPGKTQHELRLLPVKQ